MRSALVKGIIVVGVLAQVVVPSWMLLRRYIVLTYGEKVTISVRICDPRDLLMGHYVRLEENEHVKALEGIKKNYLRYYCDQHYAKALNGDSSIENAELDVRIWKDSALAEELRIDGLPAYEYVDKNGKSKETQRVLNDNLSRIMDVISVDSFDNIITDCGRIVVRGKQLRWDKGNPEEGFFLCNVETEKLTPCKILDTYKEESCFLISVMKPLEAGSEYRLLFITRKHNKNIKVTHWNLFHCK